MKFSDFIWTFSQFPSYTGSNSTKELRCTFQLPTYDCPYYVDSNSESDDEFYESPPSYPHIYFFNPSKLPTKIRNTHITTTTPQTFKGYCVDSGASRSLIVQPQFQAYIHQLRSPINITSSYYLFHFSTVIHTSSDSFMARLSIPWNAFLCFKTYILPIYVPFLIGMDFLNN